MVWCPSLDHIRGGEADDTSTAIEKVHEGAFDLGAWKPRDGRWMFIYDSTIKKIGYS